MPFETLEQMVVATAAMVRPPERLSVAEASEKYRWLNNPGSYVGPWQNAMTPYLVEPMEVLSSLDYTAMVFVAPAQCGKALAVKTPIATPAGWTTMGELKVGDQVFGRDGRPCRVTIATEVVHDHDCYEVVFDDGASIVADADHKWAVDDMHGRSKVLTTRKLWQTYRVRTGRPNGRYRYAIPACEPLELPERRLPLDPYLLGVWLGDGDRCRGYLTLGPKDVDHILERLAPVTTCKPLKVGEGRTGVHLSASVGGSSLTSILSTMGLRNNKRVPLEYLRASEGQRGELLRGLMDTDGHAAKNRIVEFTTIFPGLRDDVCELLSSLGIKCRVTSKIPSFTYRGEQRKGQRAYRISFVPCDGAGVFSLPRHIERINGVNKARRESQTGRRWIRHVLPALSVPVRCIQVDSPDHLYLAGRQMVPTHNTDMALNWITYSAICDPADMMLVQTSQSVARDFSKRRIERLFRHSKEVGARVIPGRNNQNTYDVRFTAGWMLTLSWPTINELSGKPIPRLWLTDYDRMPQNVDDEGAPFDLARKRATTFRRHGMTVAESSPGFEVENTRWIRQTPHEAPPTRGILALYNRGDRRRWYWRCPSCRDAFEPAFSLLTWPDTRDFMDAAEQAVMGCPQCGQVLGHEPAGGIPGKHEMNHAGRWIRDGMVWTPEGAVVGTPIRSDIASFWLMGVAAAFADWKTLVLNYLKAVEEFEQTGSQDALKTTVNTDQGLPYVPRGMDGDRLPEDLKARAADMGERVVPAGVRFLLASIDIQKNRFVVQVHGLGENFDIWIIDRFDVRKSQRLDADGERYWVSPGAYPEDWQLLVDAVILKSYPLDDGSGRHMAIKAVACDSGGREGVTANAYNFWRWLRDDHPLDLNRRFQVLQGTPLKSAPRVVITYPDSERKDRKAGARGEIPVMRINSDAIKDQVSKMLDRAEAGGGKVNFPDWLPDSFYTELTAETRTAKGWENPKRHRNEAWDLLCYGVALAISPHVKIEMLDWGNPPEWAAEWGENDLVFVLEHNKPFVQQSKDEYTLTDLAAKLA